MGPHHVLFYISLPSTKCLTGPVSVSKCSCLMNPFTGSRTPLTLSPHGIQDSLVFWIPCRGFRIPGTAVRIPIRNCIPDSLSCIPESKAQRSRIQSKISWIPESVHKRKFPRVRNPDSPTWGEYFPWAAGRVINAKRFTSGEPDSKQVAVISKENSRFRFRFQNKRTPFHIMFRLYKSLR